MMTEWYPAHTKPAPVQGWRLVPIEPTNEMMRAFFEAAGKWVNEEGADEDVYIAMLDAAPNSHECTRSHPHENMDAMCELRTEIARLTNENARLKAQPSQQSCYCPECERLSKELAELKAERTWVGLTDEEHEEAVNVCLHVGVEGLVFWLEDKLKEKNNGN